MRHLHAETLLAQIPPCTEAMLKDKHFHNWINRGFHSYPSLTCNIVQHAKCDSGGFLDLATQRHLARCELVLEMVTRSMSWSHFLKCRAKVPLCKHKKSADSSVVWVAFNDLVWRFLLRKWGTSMGVSGRSSSSGSDLSTAFVLVYFCANGKGFEWNQTDARWSSQNVGQIWVAARKQGLPLFGPALCPGCCFWLICGDASK